MKHKSSLYKFRILSIFVILALVFGYARASPAIAAAPYTLIDLGTLGGSSSISDAINGAGQVIGRSFLAGNTSDHAFVWDNGVMTELSLGGSYSYANAINEAGQVIGHSKLANEYYDHAFVWDNGVMTELTLSGGKDSRAVAINGAGQVIGSSDLADQLYHHAFVWENGVMTDLGTFGGRSSGVVAINEAGQVIGRADLPGNTSYHAFMWDNGVMTDLGTLGGSNSGVAAINEAGQVIGTAFTTNGYHAFRWDSGVMTDLGTLGGSLSGALAINEAGQVIGYSYLAGNAAPHAFVWAGGVMTDLTLGGNSYPVAINEAGQVIGYSNLANGKEHGFMWEDGVMTDLGALSGGYSRPIAINEAGQIIGYSYLANNDRHAFVWEDGVMTDLTLGGRSSEAIAINEAGQVIGWSYLAGNIEQHAFVWDNGVLTDLGTFGGSNSYARAINEAGQVIGNSQLAGNTSAHAFVATAATHTNTDIYIGGIGQAGYYIAPHQSVRTSFAGVNNGPVQISNTQSTSMMAAERVIYKVNGVNTSFSEMMGLPNQQLDTTYWLPWYNNADLDTQLRFANVSDSPATVHAYVGGTEMPGSPFTLAAGASTRQSFAGINNGPVKIESNVDIVAAERVIYKVNGVSTSFSETMALPDSQLDNIYWLPWYNNVDLDTQLRFANVSGPTATVHVYIGGTEMPGSPLTLAPGASTRKSFPGVNNGPVKIESNVKIVAAERVIYKVNGVNTSFSEMMGLPDSQLDTTYWLPWYNNVDLDTQLRFANVSGSPATVHVYVGGTEMPGSPFTLAAGASIRRSFPGVNNGPVKIESNVPIVAAERVIYKVNGVNTSFSEMMGLPNQQLDKTYWLPWYNNVDLDTQLRFGIP